MTGQHRDVAAALAPVEALLHHWIGLDASALGGSAVLRAARQRMDALGIDDPAAFISLIRDDAAERDLLVEEVVVGESWFFRDPQVFDFVRDVAATLAALPGRRPVRILCAPCAGGEEPYSVAMALLAAGMTVDQFTIDAVDVSRRGLERAARGRYSANAFRNADLSFRDRWFSQDAGQAVIDERVRAAVSFSWANLLDANFPAGRGGYDVIFCRNLLIYLTTEARGRIERTLDTLLRADGILILGAAEPPILKGDWIPAGTAAVFAMRRGVHATAAPARVASRSPTRSRAHRPTARVQAPADRGPAPAATGTGPTVEDLLREAGRLANAHRYGEALAVCERGRQALPPAPELFFLMGMLHQAIGDLDRAEGCFHKTLYLDATHAEALLALALLASQRGDTKMADTYRQSAARALAKKGPA